MGPPPGYSVSEVQERSYPLTLRPEQVLLMVSDGVDGERVRRGGFLHTQLPPEELAAEILERGTASADDDATVVVIRLESAALPSS